MRSNKKAQHRFGNHDRWESTIRLRWLTNENPRQITASTCRILNSQWHACRHEFQSSKMLKYTFIKSGRKTNTELQNTIDEPYLDHFPPLIYMSKCNHNFWSAEAEQRWSQIFELKKTWVTGHWIILWW